MVLDHTAGPGLEHRDRARFVGSLGARLFGAPIKNKLLHVVRGHHRITAMDEKLTRSLQNFWSAFALNDDLRTT